MLLGRLLSLSPAPSFCRHHRYRPAVSEMQIDLLPIDYSVSLQASPPTSTNAADDDGVCLLLVTFCQMAALRLSGAVGWH